MVVQYPLGYFENGAWHQGRYTTITREEIDDLNKRYPPTVWDYDSRPIGQICDANTYALKDHTHDENPHDIVIELDYIPTLVVTAIVAIVAFVMTMMFIRFI